MIIQRRILAITLFAALSLAACGEKPADDSKVLATVNGEAITENDYDNYLKARQAQQAPIPDKDREREVVLDEMINRLLLVQEARRTGVDREPDVYFQLKRQTENTLARGLLRTYVKDHPITDEDLQKRYALETEKMNKSEFHARHILSRTEDEAKDNLKALGGGVKFERLAKEKSADARSAKEGGDLGWFNQGSMVPEFFAAVAAMKPGEISTAPVKTDFGWHVIMLVETRPLTIPPLDQVRPNITQLVQQGRVDELVNELKAKAKIKK
jgi:peptidyl-prolyl cis-trans isomerase C